MIEVNDAAMECAVGLVDETGDPISHVVSNPRLLDWIIRDGGFNPNVCSPSTKKMFAQLVFDQFVSNERREAQQLISEMYEE